MKLITWQSRIEAIPEKLKEDYFDEGEWLDIPFSDKSGEDLYKAIIDCDGDPVALIELLSYSWIEIICTECGADVPEAIELGEDLDYESSTVWICRDCMRLAAEKFKMENQ